MVKKLLKHEFIAIGRVLLPAAIVVLALALLSSVSVFFSERGTQWLSMLLMSVFSISVSTIFILAYVLCVKRFYDSVFSKQGYMTLSLPVSPMQLLFAKTFVAVIALIFSFVVVLLAGELFGLIHQIDIIGNIVSAIFSSEVESGLIVYGLCVGLVMIIAQLLFIYACISAGQLFNKHRNAFSILIWFVLNQIFSIVSSLFMTFILAGMGLGNVNTFYISLTFYLVFYLLLAVGSVFFIRYILKNKVNLLA